MNIGVVLAGGSGSRIGSTEKPKQFIDVCGKPVIIHTLENFNSHPEIDALAVVCLKEWQEELKLLINKYEINKVKWVIDGGKTRQESTFSAVKNLNKFLKEEDIILIHDAARPLVSSSIISSSIRGAYEFGAANTVIPATDTIIKSLDKETIESVPARKELYMVQTPQSFKLGIIKKAHEKALKDNIKDVTDDCQLVLSLGEKVHLTEGDKLNFKITTRQDLIIFTAVIKTRQL